MPWRQGIQIVDGVIEHARNRQKTAGLPSPESQKDPRHELIINGGYIEIELDNKSHVLLPGHRVIIAGIVANNVMTGYAYKNVTTVQEGYSGSSGLALIFGGILSAVALAALYSLLFSYTNIVAKLLLICTILVLMAFAYIIAGQPVRGLLAKRAIDRFSDQMFLRRIN